MNPQHAKHLRLQSIFLLLGLAVQYLLGMYLNFYVSFPDGISGGSAWEFAWTHAAVAAHIILGFLLITGAIAFLVRTFMYHGDRLKAPALWGLIGISLAALGGSAFVPTQTDAFSYLMSLSFLLAF